MIGYQDSITRSELKALNLVFSQSILVISSPPTLPPRSPIVAPAGWFFDTRDFPVR